MTEVVLETVVRCTEIDVNGHVLQCGHGVATVEGRVSG